MNANLKSIKGNTVTVEVKFKLTDSMLETEDNILTSLNEAGCLATSEALHHFDTEGSKLVFGEVLFFSKGQLPKKYQTPYGEVSIKRHVYQSNQGGKTFCPMERDARIVTTSTPRFAKMVSNKMAQGATTQVHQDLLDNHGRNVTRMYISTLSKTVASVVQAKEEEWAYTTPELKEEVSTVAIGLDGTCMLLCNDNYREAMTGTLSLYDKSGERLHTIYIGAAPEAGKASFLDRLEREISHIKRLYPKANYVGIADGAEVNWRFLKPHVSRQILDFYHASGYLKDASEAVSKSGQKNTQWFEDKRHELRHTRGAAKQVLKDMNELKEKKLTKAACEKLDKAITYFSNHYHQMNYVQYKQDKLPIGSGVTEAACKTLIKQRLCCSGMKWVTRGAQAIISLRSLVLTKGRWEQFWNKVDRYGYPVAA